MRKRILSILVSGLTVVTFSLTAGCGRVEDGTSPIEAKAAPAEESNVPTAET